MNSIYGAVTLYNPDIKEAARNIDRYIAHIDRLLVWANSPVDKDELLGLISEPGKVEFFQSEDNSGVCKPINEAIKRAKEGGYKYLLTMDQDSTWPDFPSYLAAAEALRQEDPSVTITGPYAVELTEDQSPEDIKAPGGVLYLEYVIVSGAIYDLSMFDTTGGFNDVYFIDASDEEFCLRAARNGFKHAVLGGCLLMHRFGERVEHRPLGIKIVTHNYSALRYYYSVRNHIWLIRSGYAPASRRFKLFGRYVVKTFIRALFFEEGRKAKVSAVMRGIKDGLSNEHKAEWRKC